MDAVIFTLNERSCGPFLQEILSEEVARVVYHDGLWRELLFYSTASMLPPMDLIYMDQLYWLLIFGWLSYHDATRNRINLEYAKLNQNLSIVTDRQLKYVRNVQTNTTNFLFITYSSTHLQCRVRYYYQQFVLSVLEYQTKFPFDTCTHVCHTAT